MVGAGQHADLFAVGDDAGRVEFGDGDAVGIRQRRQQFFVQAQLRQQVGFGHGVLGRGQQGQRQQVHRVHVGGAVDVDLDLVGDVFDGGVEPRRFFVRVGAVALAPVRRVHGQHLVQEDRLAEVHRHLAVVLAQDAGGGLEQGPDGFFFLGLAGQFVEVALALDQLLVADVDRLEHHRPARRAQEGLERHHDHAALGRQQPAGARAAAFDEIFERKTFRHQLRHVFAQHRGVQRIALDRAADEERAAAAKDRAQHRHVEVDAGDDVRRHHAAAVEQVAQQQVVHVAAVAGHVDHFVPGRDLLERVHVVHVQAVVDAVPEAGQRERGRTHHGVGIVGGDFPGESVRLFPGVEVFGAVAAGLVGDRLAHRFGVEHAVHQQAARGQVGADDRGLDAAEVRAQHPADLAHLALVRHVVAEDFPDAHARRELHHRVAAVEQDRQQPAEAAHQRPVFREQHREPARLPRRRPADEDRHRHQLHVLVGVEAVRHQQARQCVGMAAVLRAPEQAGAAARQRHVGALAAQRVARQRRQRRGQAGFAAGAVQDQGVRQPVVFDDVTDRPVEIEGRLGGLALDFDPGLEQRFHEARPDRRFAGRTRGRARRGRVGGVHACWLSRRCRRPGSRRPRRGPGTAPRRPPDRLRPGRLRPGGWHRRCTSLRRHAACPFRS